jgi:hypothetical protein
VDIETQKETVSEFINRCKAIVNELLIRLKSKAKFVTVSGQVGNETNPETLYRKCGFDCDDIWCVVSPK